ERRQMDPPVLSRLCGQPGAATTVRAGLQSGELSAAGGAAASGASLDVDDFAGETDQDWGEGCAPFPEDCLPNGGSSSAARVVPDDFGTDWTTEIGNREVRMKKKLQDSHEYNGNHGRGVFASGRKWACEPKKHRNTPGAREKPWADWKKDLHNLGAGRKSRKPPTP